MGAAGALVLALLGISWEPLGRLGTMALLAPALCFAALPAAHACVRLVGTLWSLGKPGRVILAATCASVVPGIASVQEDAACVARRCLTPQPLTFGLNNERRDLVQRLLAETQPDARILWEDRPVTRASSRWAAMLPLLAEGRSFIGGLDPDGTIEPAWIGLIDLSLDRKPIATWTDGDLEEYCRRYNVGWVVCWSPPVLQRFLEWSAVAKVAAVHDDGEGWLLRINRPHSFTLKGKAQLVSADSRYIALKYVEPENGVVVLSLHYQAGMRATPGRVQIEPEVSGEDIRGFVRLRLAERAECVTITWTK
jgi:hypothetical protein